MKKGLSVLLIAAALFGFYGGAVSINDVLACKDYWEKEGEKSTADMNKLEDGLNQLKDNEQAYLDGLETLAEGEKTLADGEAQYAEGLANYEAAPGKLAAAREAISEGEGQLSDLKDLINGIQQVLDNYPTFRNGYKQLRDGRTDTLKAVPKLAETLSKVQTLLTKYHQTAALQSLGKASATLQRQAQAVGFTNDDYDDFDSALKNLGDALKATSPILAQIDNEVVGIKDGPVKEDGTTLKDVEKVLKTSDFEVGVGYIAAQRGITPDEVLALIQQGIIKEADVVSAGQGVKASAVDEIHTVIGGKSSDLQELVTNFDSAELGKLGEASTDLQSNDPETVANGIDELRSILGNVHAAIGSFQTMLDGYINEKTGSIARWTGGYAELQKKRTAKDGLPKLVSGISQIVGGVYGSGNKELIRGMNKAASAFGFNAHSLTPTATSMLTKDLNSKSWMENFYNDGNKVEKAFKSVLPKLKKKYSAGNKTLKAGKAQYAQGLADYAAAPGKLADAEKQLADGRQQLADGKKKLAEYEDGEQQVRDGLATLMGTEADLDLESILDRRNGDDEFDDANGHLQLDEGLDAVKTGREYQADDGVLITKEITARAIGTVGCLAAAALAILAGVLSLLKKYKAAAVSAVLTAIAGGVGIAQGMSAGEYFSSIAGSTVGNTPFIAAGVLAAVAAVFAIVNFTAKKEEA